MKRTMDPGQRIIRYVNRKSMLMGGLSILLAIVGSWLVVEGRFYLWPLIVLGLYFYFMFSQYPNMTLHYTCQLYMLWWGPFFPIRRKKGTYRDLREISLRSSVVRNALFGIKQEEWQIHLVTAKGKNIFFHSFYSKDKAEELARILSSDLLLNVRIVEETARNISPVPRIQERLFGKRNNTEKPIREKGRKTRRKSTGTTPEKSSSPFLKGIRNFFEKARKGK